MKSKVFKEKGEIGCPYCHKVKAKSKNRAGNQALSTCKGKNKEGIKEKVNTKKVKFKQNKNKQTKILHLMNTAKGELYCSLRIMVHWHPLYQVLLVSPKKAQVIERICLLRE